MKANTPELMKFKRLQRRLNDTRRGIVGLLESLWIGVAKNCPEGDVGRFSNEEIAIMVDWDGDPDLLVDALVDCRWLDLSETHRLVVHDWAEHCPTYVRGGLAKQRKEPIGTSYRSNLKQPEVEPIGTTKANTSEVSSTIPSLTKPNQAKPREREGASQEFQKTWNRWKMHSLDKGKAINGISEETQLIKLCQAYPDESEQIAAIEHAIGMNWANINLGGDHNRAPPEAKSNGRKQKTTFEELGI